MPFVDEDIWNVNPEIIIPQEVLNDIIKNTNDNLLIIAGPGTGKTELLAQKACFLLQTGKCKYPRKILTLCFKIDAAANIKERVIERCGIIAEKTFVSMTFDSFFISIVRRFSCFLPTWVNQLNNNFEVGPYNNDYFPLDLNAEITDNIKTKVNDCIKENKLTWMLCRSLAYSIIKNSSEVKKIIFSTYGNIFLDEFQDTTKEQYQFIKEIFHGTANKIVAVGDTNQTIMRWAGADVEIFNKFQNDFQVQKYNLNINHRSNKNIVDFINYVGKNITNFNENFVEYVATRGSTNDNSIFAMQYKNKYEEADAIAAYISKELKSNNLLKGNDFALIIRQKTKDYYNTVADIFKSYNLEIRDEDREIYNGGLRVQDIIEEPLSNLFLNILRKKEKIINPRDNNYMYNTYAQLRNINISNERQYKKLVEEIKKIIAEIDYNNGIESITNTIISNIGSNINRYKILSNESDYKKIKKSFDIYFQECLNNSQNIEEAINKYIGKDQIRLMTVHKSKGLEFETVFFVDFNIGSWWNLDNAYQNNDFIKITEEKNIFFVGASRAKENLIFTNGEENKKWPPIIEEIIINSKMIKLFK